jgi:hypothetical protein
MATTTTLLTSNTAGSSEIEYEGGRRALLVPISFTFSASYATGGEPLTLPDDISGRELKAVFLLNPLDGTRVYQWDGSTSAPKIIGYTALNTQVANAVDLSAVTTRYAYLLYAA